MEETGTRDTKVSDSGYSNSCNSQSQRSSRSSKSRHSNSSGSSGYCGHAPSTQGSSSDPFSQPSAAKHSKDKEHKKKKLKSSYTSDSLVGTSTAMLLEAEAEEMEKPDKVELKLETEVSCDREVCPLAATATVPELDQQLVTLQQTLSCIQNTKKKERNDISSVIHEENEGHASQREIKENNEDHHNLEEASAQSEGEFSVVVSMQDGVVVYTTPSLTEITGFPKDMWIGRSFIDFVHPKDKEAFTSHITSGVVTPLMHTQCSGDNLFFCRLRKYRGLKSSGYGITQKEVTYLPFLLKTSLVEFPVSYTSSKNSSSSQGSRSCMYLIIRAKQLTSAFKQPEETRVSPKFVTRHLASCKLSHVDPEMVPYIGYLPQDLIGNSILDFCHPEDLPFLKEVYQRVMREQGAPFCSKPYRFKAQNGSYVTLETEWSSFINPWTHKLEFVIGHHRILKGPKTADVFAAPNNEETAHTSEEVLKESKIIEEEIKALLDEMYNYADISSDEHNEFHWVPRISHEEPIHWYSWKNCQKLLLVWFRKLDPCRRSLPVDQDEKVTNTYQAERQQMSKRCADLATFMESLIADPLKTDLKLEMPQEGMSFWERDSVMLGEISPHHDYCDSKSSSETPPSYNQLNYNDNIQRFFESKPKTTLSDESGESKTDVKAGSLMSTDEDGKSGPAADSSGGSSNNGKCCSSGNGSGSGSGHGSGHSSGSGGNGDTTSQPAAKTSINSYKPPVLTKALLYRHNEDMEKKMVQKHREQRNKGLERESKQKKCLHDKNALEQCHGLKRSGSHSWEGGEAFRSNKHLHTEGEKGTAFYQEPVKQGPTTTSRVPPTYNGGASINLWPPFSVTVAPLQYSQPCPSHGYAPTNTSPMIPLFYIPSGSPQTGIAPQEHPGPPPTKSSDLGMMSGSHTYVSPQLPYVTPPMMYQYPTPMYSGLPMMFPAMAMPQPTPPMCPMQRTVHSTVQPCNKENKGSPAVAASAKFQRPASQATSVKAEPGSAIGSIASASVKRGMSESSNKEKSLCSPGEQTSAELSQDDERRNRQEFGVTNNLDGTGDESTFSSFYSFLQMEKSDCSMKSSPEDMVWEKSENHKSKPRPVLKEPPWMEGIKVTSDLVYRYQIKDRVIGDVLQADMKALECINQPLLVNEQLSQLYKDMELEGLSHELKLEEGITSSSGSSGEEQFQSCTKAKKKQRKFEYGKLVMIFEENAPLPSPPCTS